MQVVGGFSRDLWSIALVRALSLHGRVGERERVLHAVRERVVRGACTASRARMRGWRQLGQPARTS